MKIVKCTVDISKCPMPVITEVKGSVFLLALKAMENGEKVENASLVYDDECLLKSDLEFQDFDVYRIEVEDSMSLKVEVNEVQKCEIKIVAKESSVVYTDLTNQAQPEQPEPAYKFIIGPNVPKTMMRFNIGEWYDYHPGQIIQPCTYAEFTGNARLVDANGGVPYIVVGGCPITKDTMLMEFVVGYTITTSKNFQSCFGFLNDNPNAQGMTSNRNYRNVVNVEFDTPVNYTYKDDPTVKTYLPALQKLELSGDIIVENVPQD